MTATTKQTQAGSRVPLGPQGLRTERPEGGRDGSPLPSRGEAAERGRCGDRRGTQAWAGPEPQWTSDRGTVDGRKGEPMQGPPRRLQGELCGPSTHPESRLMWPRSVVQRLRMRMGVPRELTPSATLEDTFTSQASCRRPPRGLRRGEGVGGVARPPGPTHRQQLATPTPGASWPFWSLPP